VSIDWDMKSLGEGGIYKRENNQARSWGGSKKNRGRGGWRGEHCTWGMNVGREIERALGGEFLKKR